MGNVRKMKPPTGVETAVRSAVAAMTWLRPSDQAMVELALAYARQIDAAGDDRSVGWLGPHLANALRSLGGTPADRRSLGVEDAVRGKLAELRAARSS